MTGREEAEQVLAPHLDRIRQCINGAVNEYKSILNPSLQTKFSTRTRASGINDLMRFNVMKQFDGVVGARCTVKRGQFRLYIGNHFSIRFKKFDRRLRTSNIPTGQALRFENQKPDQLHFDLPGAPPPTTNLFAGYRFNLLQTAVDGLFIVCPNGGRNEWVLEVTQPMRTAEVVPIAPQRTAKRVRPKVSKVEEKDEQ